MTHHTVPDALVTLRPGQPAILMADGKIDYDRARPLEASEERIQLPELSSRPPGRWVITVDDSPTLSILPIGTKIILAVFAVGDLRSPPMDGKTVIFHGVPADKAIRINPRGCTVTGDLDNEPGCESITLTKTEATTWQLAGLSGSCQRLAAIRAASALDIASGRP
ncbi:hypothetical protein [Bradyrhizobium sp. USDA 3364]